MTDCQKNLYINKILVEIKAQGHSLYHPKDDN